MSFNTFLANPKAYLQTHAMQVGNTQATTAAMTAGPAAPNAAHGSSVLWTQGGANFLTMNHTRPPTNFLGNIGRKLRLIGKRNIQYSTAASAGDLGYRYLPFGPNQVTYMAMDPAATFVLTGPLSGCSIAAGRTVPGGVVYLFHANANGPPPGGVPVKQAMINNAAGIVGVPLAGLHRCDFGAQYNGLGFVFGRLRAHGVWKFYVHSLTAAPNGGVNAVTTKFGQL